MVLTTEITKSTKGRAATGNDAQEELGNRRSRERELNGGWTLMDADF
jgi:hypothetical protein